MLERKNKEYTHITSFENEILEMKNEGKTNREIAEHFGFRDKYVVKQFIARYHRKEKRLKVGIQPRKRGRPSKGYIITEQEKDNEIKRLKMENELLRDFLRLAGRK
jgi:predicted ArsR family transcriptional regulator